MRNNSPRRLIVNADDFGLSESVNAGILAAHRHGILSSATLLANAPSFAEAVAMARSVPSLGVGIHLNIVRGRPLSDPSCLPELLDGQGQFRRFRYRRMTPGFLHQAEVEYRRQIETVLYAGLHPTHIDFEKHHAWQGGLYHLACRLAGEYGIQAARTLREPVLWSVAAVGWPGWRKAGMAAMLRGGVWLLGGGGAGLRQPDRLLGQTHIGCMDETAWIRLLARLPNGTSEVMTHPGLSTTEAEPMGGSWLAAARAMEYQALVSPAVVKAVEAAEIERIHFGQLR